jgi:4-amino-4-deoxy-L-arabinose transferase-like glycosyltransferase
LARFWKSNLSGIGSRIDAAGSKNNGWLNSTAKERTTQKVQQLWTAIWRKRIELVLILALALVALCAGLRSAPLIDWDEATYAEVAHEAIVNHHYADFTWNGQPYLKKPPLLFWMVAGSFKVFGEGEVAARLPSIAAALGTLLVIYFSAAETGGRLAGTLAATIPLSFYFFIARGGSECATDPPLIFFMTLSVWSLFKARLYRKWLALAGVACGLAILSKGLAGTIPLIVALLAVASLPEFREVGASGLIVMALGAGIVAAPWYAYQSFSAYPLFFSKFFGHETMSRVFTNLGEDESAARSSFAVLSAETRHLWPLGVPILALMASSCRTWSVVVRGPRSTALTLWALWFMVAIAAACAVQTKLGWYVLPALIPVALICGTLTGMALTAERGRTYLSTLALAGLAAVAFATPNRWRAIRAAAEGERARSRPTYSMAMRAKRASAEIGGEELYFAGPTLPTLVYYSGLRCRFVDTAEMKLVYLKGAPRAPREIRFHDLVLLDSKGAAFVVANLDREWKGEPPPPDEAEADDAVLIAGFPEGWTAAPWSRDESGEYHLRDMRTLRVEDDSAAGIDYPAAPQMPDPSGDPDEP